MPARGKALGRYGKLAEPTCLVHDVVLMKDLPPRPDFMLE